MPDFDDLPSSFQDSQSQMRIWKSGERMSEMDEDPYKQGTMRIDLDNSNQFVDPANLESSVDSSPVQSDDNSHQISNDRNLLLNESDGGIGRDIAPLVKGREIKPSARNNQNNLSKSGDMDIQFNKTTEYCITNQSLQDNLAGQSHLGSNQEGLIPLTGRKKKKKKNHNIGQIKYSEELM